MNVDTAISENRTVETTLNYHRYLLLPMERGGMAQIYRAKPRNRKSEELTLKILHGELIASPRIVDRFREEYRLLKQLRHDRLPHAAGHGKLGGRPYMAYRYIKGTPALKVLKDAAKTSGTDPKTTCLIIRDLLMTLDYLHRRKRPIIHSDISPENLLLGNQNDVYLIDFGSAQQLVDRQSMATTWIGKPSYLSPEQAQGFPWDHRSDIYQTGVVFYELLAGKKLNQGKGKAQSRTIAANPPAPQEHFIPAPLLPVLRRMLQFNPVRRFASARSCIHAMDQVYPSL